MLDAFDLAFINHRSLLALADYGQAPRRTAVLQADLPVAAELIDILDLQDVLVEGADVIVHLARLGWPTALTRSTTCNDGHTIGDQFPMTSPIDAGSGHIRGHGSGRASGPLGMGLGGVAVRLAISDRIAVGEVHDMSVSDHGAPRTGAGARSDPDLVFVSYSHADRDWMRRLKVLLDPVVRNRRLAVWADEHILIGNEWRRDIAEAIFRAGLAICLVSADFLASRFIIEEELPALREAGVRVVPVLVHECLWQEEPYFAEVQWAHDPGRDGPLDLHNERDGERDRRLTVLCKRVLELLPPRTVVRNDEELLRPWPSDIRPLSAGSRGSGRVDGAPELPLVFLARDEFVSVRAAVLDDRSAAVGVAGRTSGIGLAGQGGIGKTVLAIALARDPEVRRNFPDGVFWVTLGENADPLTAQLDLLARLGVTSAEVRSVTQGTRALRETLAQRQCLLVVDDVWSAAAAKAFAVTGALGRVLYTTRDPRVLDSVGAQMEQIDVLSEDLSRRLLAQLSGTKVEDFPAEVDRVLTGTGRVALALALVAAAVRDGASWVQVVAELDRSSRVFGTHPYANTFKALQLAMEALGDADTDLYLSLAVFPRDTRIPLTVIGRYWHRLRGNSPEQTHARLRIFAERQLLALDTEQSEISFHDLQHDYLLLQVDELELLHTDLLSAYRDLLTTPDQWWQLPADEPYLWDHLIHHLKGAGDSAGLTATLTDSAYLITRTFLHGPQATEADLRRSQGLLPNPDQEWWLRWFGHYGYLLAGLPTLSDTAATAALRLTDATPTHNKHLRRLDVLRSPPYLTPAWGLVPAPQTLRRILSSHRQVWSVAFSPDGQLLASAGLGGAVRVWDSATGTELRVLTGHRTWVKSVVFNPGGRLLASAGEDGTVRVWDTATGTEQRVLTGHHGAVWSVAFSPDSQLLASAGLGGTVRVWDTATGTEQRVLTGHHGAVWSVAFSPDGQLLVSAGEDGAVRVWDSATGTEQRVLTGHHGAILSVTFSPDSQLLASAGNDRTVRVWDSATGTEQRVLTGHHGAILSVAFSPDSQLLASAGNDGIVEIWDHADVCRSFKLGLQVRALSWHEDLLGVAVDSSVVVLRLTPMPDSLAATGSHGAQAGHPARAETLASRVGKPRPQPREDE